MIKCYVKTEIVKAEPAGINGAPGYNVFSPNGYVEWFSQDVFESNHRELTRHERKLIEMTDAEASIARISDG